MKNTSLTKKIGATILIIVLTFFVYNFSKKPSLDRNWAEDQKILADIKIDGEKVHIKNIRDFEYKSVEEYNIGFIDEEYNIGDIESLYYIIEPFGSFEGPAHTMMSFGFSDGRYLVISAEIRKEVGETFSPIKGLFRNYEMNYVIGTEEDLIKLRSNYRKDDVFLYPINAEKENIQKLFISMLKRAIELSENPEFYNTITHNCTTAILGHVNEIKTEKIAWNPKVLMPAHSDRVLYELGFIDTRLSLKQARDYYKINTLSEKFSRSSDYSEKIRKVRK